MSEKPEVKYYTNPRKDILWRSAPEAGSFWPWKGDEWFLQHPSNLSADLVRGEKLGNFQIITEYEARELFPSAFGPVPVYKIKNLGLDKLWKLEDGVVYMHGCKLQKKWTRTALSPYRFYDAAKAGISRTISEQCARELFPEAFKMNEENEG